MRYLTENLHQKHLNALADVELLEREYQHICTEEKNLKYRLKVIQKRQQVLVNPYREDSGLIEAKKSEAQTLLERHNTIKLPKCVIRPEYEQKPTWRVEKVTEKRIYLRCVASNNSLYVSKEVGGNSCWFPGIDIEATLAAHTEYLKSLS